MKLYEIDIGSLWWLAADDEFEAMEIMRDELRMREIGDEEMDEVLEDLTVVELRQEEAEMISVVDDIVGDSMDSLWAMFLLTREPSLITSDYHRDEDEEDGDISNEDGCLPVDWI
jgi:hypothetical protein